MSGGSYDYAYQKMDEMADQLMHQDDPLRAAFGRHLKKVAKAAHDIEWVDSSDYGDGDETAAIRQCLHDADAESLEVIAERIESLIAAYQRIREEQDNA